MSVRKSGMSTTPLEPWMESIST